MSEKSIVVVERKKKERVVSVGPIIPVGGGAGGGGATDWTDVQNKPATFPPDAHDHDADYDPLGAATDAVVGSTKMTGLGAGTVLTYNEATRTVTIAPTGSDYQVFVQGEVFTKTSESLVHPDTGGGHFYYFDNTGALVTSQSPWNLLTHAPVAYVFWDAANNLAIPFDERHNAGRDIYWHRNQHSAEGTKATSGFGASGYTLSNGASDAAVTFAIATGRVEDEDIRVDTQVLADDGPYTIIERVGVSGEWRITRGNTLPFFHAANALQYNQNNGGTWQRTAMTEDYFVNYWVLATTALPTTSITPPPSSTQQIIIVPGQTLYSSEAAAHGETIGNLSWGTLPFQEVAPLYQVTMRYNANNPQAYSNTARCAISRFARVIGTNAAITQAAQTDHGALAGLSDDDHTQYALANSSITAVTYNAGGTTTIALDGRCEHYTATAATGSTTWAVTGAPANKSTGFILDLTNGGSQTQNWPAGSDFDGGVAPTLTAAGKDRLVFQYDGSAWAIALATKDFK